jgi:uncharacterized protein (DUF2062 family)
MSILDEIEVHATQTARLQARADNVALQRQAYEFFAKKRAGKIFAVSVVAAFIPFIGWGITLMCWLFSAEYVRTLDPKTSGYNAGVVGTAWGILTALIPWGTYAIGLHAASNVEMLVFYAIAALLVYANFSAYRSAKQAARVSREVAEHIANQS